MVRLQQCWGSGADNSNQGIKRQRELGDIPFPQTMPPLQPTKAPTIRDTEYPKPEAYKQSEEALALAKKFCENNKKQSLPVV